MKKDKSLGFEYYLSKETIKKYQEKLPELRLQWLYLGNILRKSYPDDVVRTQNRFRNGTI